MCREISVSTPHVFQTKVSAHIDREVAAQPELVQIENGYRHPKQQRPGAVQRGHFREIDALPENPDAEPPCASAKTAIIVYGKRIGTKLTVCTGNKCPIHDPRGAARLAANPAPTIAPVQEAETEEQAEQRKAEYEQRRKEYEAELEREEKEHCKQEERQEQEREAKHLRTEELREKRKAMFERILENAPATLSTAQLRVLLRAIVHLDPYTLADDLAENIADENDKRDAEEVLTQVIDGTADDKLTAFAIRLALSGQVGIPRESEYDFLAEAEAAFAPQQPQTQSKKKPKKPTSIKADAPASPKAATKKANKKKIAA